MQKDVTPSLEQFTDCFRRSTEIVTSNAGPSLDPMDIVSKFVDLWFFGEEAFGDSCDNSALSGSLFFLYLKNLSITNVQIVELRSLIRSHARARAEHDPVSIKLMKFDEYEAFLSNCWESYLQSRVDVAVTTEFEVTSEQLNDIVDGFCSELGSVLCGILLVDDYYTCSIVHLPPNIVMDVEAAVSRSGYIHSAGRTVYARGSHNADPKDFFGHLERVVLSQTTAGMTLLLPYAEELFAGVDRETSFSGRNGLFETQFRLSKHYVGHQRLETLLQQLKAQYPERIYIPSAEDIPTLMRGNLKDDRIVLDRQRSIFIIVDRACRVDPEEWIAYPGDKNYIICYLQLIKNANPLLEIKERKIGWEAPVTLPHTLSTALLNVCMSGRENLQEVTKLYDPFCGSGTTLIDTVCGGRHIAAFGSDLSHMAGILLNTNLEFLGSDSEGLSATSSFFRSEHLVEEHLSSQAVKRLLSRSSEDVNRSFRTNATSPGGDARAFQAASELLRLDLEAVLSVAMQKGPDAGLRATHEVERAIESGVAEAVRSLLESSPVALPVRLAFFAMRRGVLTRLPLAIYEANPVAEAVTKEYALVSRELTAIRDSRRRYEKGSAIGIFSCETGGGAHDFNAAKAAHRSASVDEFISAAQAANAEPRKIVVCPGNDSLQLLQRLNKVFDVIITDPPYGFNVEGDGVNYLDVYRKLISASISALRPHGQLMLILPEFSRNGKEVPFFQTREYIAKQVLSAAAASGRKIYRDVFLQPETKFPYCTPYYWKSARGVSRTIIHYRFF